jgi:hypothetical protein
LEDLMLLAVLAIACVPEPPPEGPPEPICEPEIVTGDCLLWRCYTPVNGGIELWYEGLTTDRHDCEDYACVDGYAAAALAECGVVDTPAAACYPLPQECGADVTCPVCHDPGAFTPADRSECSDGWDRGIASWADQAAAAQDLLCHGAPESCDGETGDTGL